MLVHRRRALEAFDELRPELEVVLSLLILISKVGFKDVILNFNEYSYLWPSFLVPTTKLLL